MSNQKAKFFAQYWGQEILWSNKGQVNPFEICHTCLTHNIKSSYIELTPLSQISNKDLKAIGFGNIGNKKLHFVFDDYDTHWKSSCGNWGTLLFKDFDHLRSKGYALPWMGISVEDLVSYGWVKLKTENNE